MQCFCKSILKSSGFTQVHNGGGWVAYKTKYNECTNLLNDWHFMRFVVLLLDYIGIQAFQTQSILWDF
jgi:hypothetical protein